MQLFSLISHISSRNTNQNFCINKGSNMCNVKGVVHRDEPTENCHLILRFLSAQRVLAFFSSLFWFYSPQLY